MGRDAFAAAALGTAYYNTIVYPLTGVAMALDTVLSQAFGARNFVAYGQRQIVCCVVALPKEWIRVGEWALCGSVVLLLLCLPAAGILLLVEPFLLLIGQVTRR